MRTQWKYFFILLAFSLGPLVVTGIITRVGVVGLGRAVSSHVERDMTSVVIRELEDAARDAARSLSQDRTTLGLAVRNLVLETKVALAEPNAPADPVYFSTDYDSPETSPDDLAPLKGHYRRSDDGLMKPVAASLSRQVFFTAPGVEPRDVAGDIRRLALLLPACKSIFSSISGMTVRMHVALESGVTAVYPGAEGYPANYDTRKTVYYAQAAAADKSGPVWSRLIFSRSTGRALFSVAMPIRVNGRLVGVAAIDFPLEHVLREQSLSQLRSDSARSFLVFPKLDEATGRTGLKVAAEEDYLDSAEDLLGSEEFAWLDLPDNPERARMVEDIAAGKPGTAMFDFQGEATLWAYSPMENDLSFLIKIPRKAAMRLPEDIVRRVGSMTRGQLMIIGIAAGVAVLFAAFTALYGASRAIGPLMEWVAAWNRAAEGDFSVRITTRTNDERDLLAEAFNATMPKLEDRIRLLESLDLAQQVQQNLLPVAPPSPVGYDVAGASRYCDETGGDYLDFQTLDDGRMLATVGDVSGHGVASALLMASARAMLRALAVEAAPLSDRTALVNRLLCADVGSSGRFMTLFSLELKPETGAVEWVRAGHDPALLYDPVRETFTDLEGQGMLMGVLEEAEYPSSKTVMEPGWILAVGTDGVWETRNPEGGQYGRKRFRQMIAQNADRSAEEIIRAVLEDLNAFRQSESPKDDVTLAVIKRFPPAA